MSNSNDISIHIIDDDAQLCESLVSILSSKGYSVSHSLTGMESISHIEAEHVDIIILDIKLPDVDGLELLRRFKSMGVESGILMLSGQATLEDAVESLNQGADAFIIKPVEPKELFERLESVNRVRILQRRLNESEKRYRMLVENSTDVIISMGLDWNILFANKGFSKLVGSSIEDIQGRTLASFITPFKSSLFLDAMDGQKNLPEFKISKSDGTTIDVEATASQIIMDGVVFGAQMIIRDISERKKDEEMTIDKAFRVNKIIPGEYYLHTDRESCCRLVSNLMLHDIWATIITSDDPEMLVSWYGIPPGSIVLTSADGESQKTVSQGFVSGVGESMERDGPGLIVVDMSPSTPHNEFEKLLQLLKEQKQLLQPRKIGVLLYIDPKKPVSREQAEKTGLFHVLL